MGFEFGSWENPRKRIRGARTDSLLCRLLQETIRKVDGFETRPFSPEQGTPKSLRFQNCASQILQIKLHTIEKKPKYLTLVFW